MKTLVKIKDDYLNIESLKIFLISSVFGFIVYSVFISNNLTNDYDGLWYSNYYFAGLKELANGRFFGHILDILRQGICSDPVCSIIFILFLVLGNIVSIKAIGINNKISIYFANMMLICSTSTLCLMSYRYMSPNFSLAYLCSAISAYLFIKLDGIAKIVSSITLLLTFSLYQSFVGVFCVLILLRCIYLTFINKTNYKDVLIIILEALVAVIIGAILYKVCWDFILNIFNTKAGSYKGADKLSVFDMIVKLPNNILNSYKYYYDFIFSNSFKINIYNYKIYIIIWLLFLILIIVFKSNIITLLLLTLLLPLAGNFCVLFNDAGFMMQQTFSVYSITPLIVSVMIDLIYSYHKSCMFYKCTLLFFSFVLFFGNFISTEIDVEAMREGKNSVESITQSVIYKLIDDDIYNSEYNYYFIGEPCDNPMFYVSDIWSMSNDYAQYGKFFLDPYSITHSYGGVIKNIGIKANCVFKKTNKYEELMEQECIKKMPLFPLKGSIKVSEDDVIIKISNTY